MLGTPVNYTLGCTAVQRQYLGRALQLGLTGFRNADASLRLEGMDPSGTPLYESVKARIPDGEITYYEGRAEILAHHQKRANRN